MKRNFFTIFLCFFYFLGTNVQAQNDHTPHGNLLNFTPPPPNAAALAKFGDIPVSYSTGVPNISIPIYAYQNKATGLNLDISLNYHAGGVRIEEKASNIGTSWALNAGGVITREMRGTRADEEAGGYWSIPALIADASPYEINPDLYARDLNPNNNPYYRYYKGIEDAEPDIFSFNFAGRSGKFVFGKNDQLLIFPKQKVDIIRSFPGGENLAFTIITEDGTKYIFNQQENAISVTGVITQSYGTSWFLSKIIAPFNAGEINFVYQDFAASYNIKSPQVYFKSPFGNRQITSQGTLGSIGVRGYEGKRLTDISFPDGVNVKFIYDPEYRCDVKWDIALKKIEITDGKNIKGFKLGQNYNYRSFTGIEPNPCVGNDNNQNFRLWLHQVTEYSGSQENNPYIIEYYTNPNSVYSLQGSMSYQQDHWGFYNAAQNNLSLLPFDGQVNAAIPPPGTVDNANRATNPEAIKEGSIKKLVYPTGGYSEFAMESNELASGTTEIYDNVYASASINGSNTSKSVLFTVQKPFSSSTQFTFDFSGCEGRAIKARITSVDESTLYGIILLAPDPLIGLKRNLSVTLAPGEYKFKYDFEPTSSQCSSFMYAVTLSWYDRVQRPSSTNQYAGGLRVKKIVENDGVHSTPIKIREYKYVLHDGVTPSGDLAVIPAYNYSYTEACYMQLGSNCTETCSGTSATYNVISSSPVFTLSNALGSPVQYYRIEEIFTGSGQESNGKIIKTYTTASWQPDNGLPFDAYNPNSLRFPFVTPQRPDWVYGLHLSDTILGSDGSIKRTIENSYSSTADELPAAIKTNFRSLKVAAKEVELLKGCNGGVSTSGIWYGLTQYYPFTGIAQLQSTTEKDYGSNGVVITKTTNYQYDADYYSVSKISNTDSKGSTIEQRLYYPHNYSIGGVLQEMLNTHHISSPVISKEIWKQEAGSSAKKLAGAEVVEYAKFNNLAIKPSKLHYINTNRPLDISVIGEFDPNQLIRNTTYFKNEIQFDNYDSKSNLLQEKKAGDIPQSFIWGYNNQYVIAEVINAPVNDIFHTSFEDAEGNSLDDDSRTGRKSKTEGYQKSLSNLSNGSYILSYWQKSGTTWNFQSSTVTVTENTYPINLSGQVDEVRFYPATARMITYTYEPLYGMISQCDVNNRVTYYEYDGFGRLTLVRDQDKNILKKICYNYAGQPENCNYYYNTQKIQAFTKDCSTGFWGPSVNYVVEAGIYSSAISQEDADQKALNDIAAKGQNYANEHGDDCKAIIYAQLTYENIQPQSGVTTGDIVVRFYSNAALTIPVSVTNLTLYWTETVAVESSVTNNPHVSTATGTSKILLSGTTLHNSVTSTTRNYYLTEGTGYIFINSGPNGGQ